MYSKQHTCLLALSNFRAFEDVTIKVYYHYYKIIVKQVAHLRRDIICVTEDSNPMAGFPHLPKIQNLVLTAPWNQKTHLKHLKWPQHNKSFPSSTSLSLLPSNCPNWMGPTGSNGPQLWELSCG